MLLTLGDLLPYSLPVALSPLPVIAVLMLLLAPGGNRGGVCFLAGRFTALILLTFLLSLLIGEIDHTAANRGSRVWLRLALGLILLAAAARTVLRPSPPRKDVPGWMRSFQNASPTRAALLGVLLTAVNLKELALVAGAGIILGAADLSPSQSLVLAIVFAGLSALGVALPVAWSLAVTEERRSDLVRVRDRLVQNSGVVMAAVLAVVGAMLIGGALRSLAAPY